MELYASYLPLYIKTPTLSLELKLNQCHSLYLLIKGLMYLICGYNRLKPKLKYSG